MRVRMYVWCVCVCVSVRACVRACVRVCGDIVEHNPLSQTNYHPLRVSVIKKDVCVRACGRAGVRACVLGA